MPDKNLVPSEPVGELVQPYPLLAAQASERVLALIDDNIGSQGFSILNFARVRTPAGGGPGFHVQTLAGEESEKEFEGIIAAWRPARVYWKDSYAGGGANKPPDCSSKDGLVGIGDPGGTCAECPYAQFGSALQPNGQPGNGQACKDIRQLLVLRQDEILPHLLSVPPTSIKAFTQYTMGLLSARVPYWGATTRFMLEKATSDQGKPYAKIIFRLGRRLNTTEQSALYPYHKRMKEVLIPLILDATSYEVYDTEPSER